MVLLRELDIDFDLVANVLADELLLKCVDECVRSDGEIGILCLAAVECLAINEALVVDPYDIAVSYRSVFNGYGT